MSLGFKRIDDFQKLQDNVDLAEWDVGYSMLYKTGNVWEVYLNFRHLEDKTKNFSVKVMTL